LIVLLSLKYSRWLYTCNLLDDNGDNDQTHSHHQILTAPAIHSTSHPHHQPFTPPAIHSTSHSLYQPFIMPFLGMAAASLCSRTLLEPYINKTARGICARGRQLCCSSGLGCVVRRIDQVVRNLVCNMYIASQGHQSQCQLEVGVEISSLCFGIRARSTCVRSPKRYVYRASWRIRAEIRAASGRLWRSGEIVRVKVSDDYSCSRSM
jgi:hypothetical protein